MPHGLNSLKPSLQSSPAPVLFRPGADTLFTLLDGQPIVFSETNQKVYELNRVGAYIWCRLLEGKTVAAISSDVSDCGIDRMEADQFVRQALDEWLGLGLMDIDWETWTDAAFHTQFANHTIIIRASGQHLLKRLELLFCQASRGTGQSSILIEIIELEGQILFRANKRSISRCAIDELAPAIKACLTELIVLRDQPDIALHAASLMTDGKGLLMCGRPGIGKSTLTLNLIHAGFRYCGDDVVLIAPDGRAEGVPFAPTIKPGSWEMISRLYSDLGNAAVHRRPDGILVRYLPVTDVHSGPFPTNWIIFLNRIEGTSAELRPLRQIDAMGRVIDGAYSADGKLSRSSFVALKRLLTGVRSFELTYSDALEARGVLEDLCHAQS